MPQYDWLPVTPRDAADHMAGFPHPWWIAGGWAIDLFLGKRARPHADMDIALLRGDETALRAQLPGWDIRIAHNGGFEEWDGKILRPPRHQFFARPTARGPWALEFLLEDHAEGVWRFRRDQIVTLPIPALARSTSDGIPYLCPEVALLYKARTSGEDEKRELDFAAAAPLLGDSARAWLHDALVKAHPGHHWIEALV